MCVLAQGVVAQGEKSVLVLRASSAAELVVGSTNWTTSSRANRECGVLEVHLQFVRDWVADFDAAYHSGITVQAASGARNCIPPTGPCKFPPPERGSSVLVARSRLELQRGCIAEPSSEKEALCALRAVLHILLSFARAFARRPVRLAVACTAEGRIVE